MNLHQPTTISDRDWFLADDIIRVQAAGGRLSLREEAFADLAGSPAEALHVLATVRRYRNGYRAPQSACLPAVRAHGWSADRQASHRAKVACAARRAHNRHALCVVSVALTLFAAVTAAGAR